MRNRSKDNEARSIDGTFGSRIRYAGPQHRLCRFLLGRRSGARQTHGPAARPTSAMPSCSSAMAALAARIVRSASVRRAASAPIIIASRAATRAEADNHRSRAIAASLAQTSRRFETASSRSGAGACYVGTSSRRETRQCPLPIPSPPVWRPASPRPSSATWCMPSTPRCVAIRCSGPIFNAKVHDWDAHLATLCTFWSSVTLLTGAYKGRPMLVHAALPDLAETHFARWLALFAETAGEVCPPAAADLFVERSQRIAQSLQQGIAMQRGAGTLAAAIASVAPAITPRSHKKKRSFIVPLATRLTDALDIRHPIISAPMAFAAGGKLASAVSSAGGLGLIGGGYGDAEWLTNEWHNAGNAAVGCGFITWSLKKQPHLLDLALAHHPRAIFLSFGDPEPFAARGQDQRHQAHLPGADAPRRRARPRLRRRHRRRARLRGGRPRRAARDPDAGARGGRPHRRESARDIALRSRRNSRWPRPRRRSDAGRRWGAGRIALLGLARSQRRSAHACSRTRRHGR